MQGAHIRALTAPCSTHTHTYRPAHAHWSTQTHAHSPPPPSCADLLESAVVVGCLPPSEEARPHPLASFLFFTLSFPLSFSLSLSCCQWNADDMTSSAKSLEKVITAHPHPYQIILFLVCSPAFQFIHHSISTSVPPSYSITFLPSYVPVQLTLHVWVYMHLSLGVSSQLTYLLPPKWSLLFQPLANRFTHINFQLSRTSIFFSGSALYPMWSHVIPLLLFILLQWVEVLSDTWGAWHTHSLYKVFNSFLADTHMYMWTHTHRISSHALAEFLGVLVTRGAASMLRRSQHDEKFRKESGWKQTGLPPSALLSPPSNPSAG